MDVDAKRANRYLRQLSLLIKRPIQRAFFYGVGKTLAIMVQLTAFALLANNILVSEQSLAEQPLLLLTLAISSLIRVLMPWAQNHTLNNAVKQVTDATRQQLVGRWQRQVKAGRPLSAADGALQVEPIAALQGYFRRYLVQQYLVVASPLLILVYCFYLNTVVGILLLLAGPVIPLFMALVGMGAEKVSQQHAERNFALSRVFTDKLRNLTTIKLFNAGDATLDHVAKAGDDYRRANMATLRVAFLSSAVLEFFSSVAIAGVALYVGFGLLGYINWLGADQLTLYSGLLVLLLAPEYFSPLRQFAQSYHDRAAAIGAASLLQEATTATESLAVQPSAATASNTGTALAWRNLQTRVGQQVLHYSDAAITAGTLTVVEGASGAGKTTLLKLLMQQQPFTGELSFATGIQPAKDIAYFSQQPFLTAGSLRANLTIFEQYSDQQLLAALAAVKLDTLLDSVAGGLDYALGEQGRGLSGGERRRLALARCILAQRPLLIADEPTENLDSESASAIIDCFQSLANKGVTVIVASHDPNLVERAQQRIQVGS